MASLRRLGAMVNRRVWWYPEAMSVATLHDEKFMPPAVRAEDQVLLGSIRAAILRWNGAGLAGAPASGTVNWQEVCGIAVRNKLAVLLWRGLNRGGVRLPPEFRARLQQAQATTLELNSRSLAALRYLTPLLEEHEIRVVVFKGPCAQRVIYGDFFSKPSSDVDLLVSAHQFEAAGRLIEANGFVLAEECRSRWWRTFLGEQHFLRADRSMAAIDLHYRTQQPGCPAPLDGNRFLTRSVMMAVGSARVRTLSDTDTVLVSCINLVKALIHREPAGGYASDVAASLAHATPGQLEELLQEAQRQGLRNTLGLGLRAARVLFGVDARSPGLDTPVVADISDANLVDVILRPWSKEIAWPRRSRLLRHLCDNRIAYLRETGWKMAEEIYLLRHRPRHPQGTDANPT